MRPVVVAAYGARRGWRRCGWVPLQPVGDNIVIILLGPEHSREGLSCYQFFIRYEFCGNDHVVEIISLLAALLQQRIEISKRRFELMFVAQRCQAKFESDGFTWVDGANVVCCRFRSGGSRVHSLAVAFNEVRMERVLTIGNRGRYPIQSQGVGFILGE